MNARMKQELQPSTELDALTVTTMVTQTQGILSQMTPPSGLTATATTVAITQMVTTQTNSQMIPHSGRTQMAMGVVTIQTDSTVMRSGKTPINGRTATATAMVTISLTATAMVFRKVTPMCAKMELTNQSPKMLLHALAVLATSVRA